MSNVGRSCIFGQIRHVSFVRVEELEKRAIQIPLLHPAIRSGEAKSNLSKFDTFWTKSSITLLYYYLVYNMDKTLKSLFQNKTNVPALSFVLLLSPVSHPRSLSLKLSQYLSVVSLSLFSSPKFGVGIFF